MGTRGLVIALPTQVPEGESPLHSPSAGSSRQPPVRQLEKTALGTSSPTSPAVLHLSPQSDRHTQATHRSADAGSKGGSRLGRGNRAERVT